MTNNKLFAIYMQILSFLLLKHLKISFGQVIYKYPSYLPYICAMSFISVFSKKIAF